AVDVLSATVLLALYSSTDTWPLAHRLAIYAVLAPFLIFLTYPACFLFGGLLLALLPEVRQANEPRSWLGYSVLALAVFGSFALLVAGPVHAQRSEAMDQCWLKSFPPWDRPWAILYWLPLSVLDVVKYACEPTGQGLAFLAVVGGISLYRQGLR